MIYSFIYVEILTTAKVHIFYIQTGFYRYFFSDNINFDFIIKKVVSLQPSKKLPHGVMVAQQILVLYVWVRVLVGQQKTIYSSTKDFQQQVDKNLIQNHKYFLYILPTNTTSCDIIPY